MKELKLQCRENKIIDEFETHHQPDKSLRRFKITNLYAKMFFVLINCIKTMNKFLTSWWTQETSW